MSATAKAPKPSTAEALLKGLRVQGFKLRLGEGGELLCSPASKLTLIQRNAIQGAKGELLSILHWEEACDSAPQPSTETLDVWYRSMEHPPPRPWWHKGNLGTATAGRRIESKLE